MVRRLRKDWGGGMVVLKLIMMEVLRLDDVKVLLSGILKGILEVEMGCFRNRG